MIGTVYMGSCSLVVQPSAILLWNDEIYTLLTHANLSSRA